MRTSGIFGAKDNEQVLRFIKANPLAWVVSAADNQLEATPLPLLPDVSADSAIESLTGHFSKGNQHVEMLRRNPRAIVIFAGEHGYISPSWMADRTQAPTWNFATIHYLVDFKFCEDLAGTADTIERLVEALEYGRPNRWYSRELGPRYDKLLHAVIGFQAKIVETKVKFKLGQNERPDVRADIIKGLRGVGDLSLAQSIEDWNSNT